MRRMRDKVMNGVCWRGDRERDVMMTRLNEDDEDDGYIIERVDAVRWVGVKVHTGGARWARAVAILPAPSGDACHLRVVQRLRITYVVGAIVAAASQDAQRVGGQHAHGAAHHATSTHHAITPHAVTTNDWIANDLCHPPIRQLEVQLRCRVAWSHDKAGGGAAIVHHPFEELHADDGEDEEDETA